MMKQRKNNKSSAKKLQTISELPITKPLLCNHSFSSIPAKYKKQRATAQRYVMVFLIPFITTLVVFSTGMLISMKFFSHPNKSSSTALTGIYPPPTPLTPSSKLYAYSPNNSAGGIPNPTKHWAFFCFGITQNSSSKTHPSSKNTISYILTDGTTHQMRGQKSNASVLTTFTSKYKPLAKFVEPNPQRQPANTSVRDPFVSFLPNHTNYFPNHPYIYFITYTISKGFPSSATDLGLACTPDFQTFEFPYLSAGDASSSYGLPVMAKKNLDAKSNLNKAKNPCLNVWAPKLLWSRFDKKYVLYWSSTIPGLFPNTDSTGAKVKKNTNQRFNHRFYYVTTSNMAKDSFSPTKLLFNGANDVFNFNLDNSGNAYANGGSDIIDLNIFYNVFKHSWVMMYKEAATNPAKQYINIAVSTTGSADKNFSNMTFSHKNNTIISPDISKTSRNRDEGPDLVMVGNPEATNAYQYILLADNFDKASTAPYDYFYNKYNLLTARSANWCHDKTLLNLPYPHPDKPAHGSLIQLDDTAYTYLSQNNNV